MTYVLVLLRCICGLCYLVASAEDSLAISEEGYDDALHSYYSEDQCVVDAVDHQFGYE